MPDKPVIHGREHHPFGMDPHYPSPWVAVASSSSAAWSSGTNYVQGNTVGDGTYNYVCVLANGPTTTAPNVYQPGVTSGWPTYWAIKAPVFLNGWGNEGSGLQPLRFRLAVGGLNHLSRLTGTINSTLVSAGTAWYQDHQVEIQGSVNGSFTVSIVFYLPPAYWPENHLRLPATDDVGGVVPFTVKNDGSVWYGIAP